MMSNLLQKQPLEATTQPEATGDEQFRLQLVASTMTGLIGMASVSPS